jgi:2-polyprenyl-3-methyl-5-hydroxy-6-metoxy-1,4-benzoquinol methylase
MAVGIEPCRPGEGINDMNIARRIHESVMRVIARASSRYYFEDFVRVYPDGVRYDRHGRPARTGTNVGRNYLNHVKFYRFAAQFVRGRQVVDVGCGSGYGCEILAQAGATRVCGADISTKAIDFARSRFGGFAEFTVQGITDLADFRSGSFDITVSSEVLEHIKEYGRERRALQELDRVTRPGGLIIVATPNSELGGDHGFSFAEIETLFAGRFEHFCIFENALVPFGPGKAWWEERRAHGKTGIVVTENINVSETMLPREQVPEFKQGLAPGRMRLADLEIDTTLLHNTHSWVILALKDPHP